MGQVVLGLVTGSVTKWPFIWKLDPKVNLCFSYQVTWVEIFDYYLIEQHFSRLNSVIYLETSSAFVKPNDSLI